MLQLRRSRLRRVERRSFTEWAICLVACLRMGCISRNSGGFRPSLAAASHHQRGLSPSAIYIINWEILDKQ